ncbi:MAG: SDR family NAD(P)-dependent oxidoreductase [Spirochaetales bacterium]|nr:SDR family NAD(P)-dependent oxidoreductase [Spirochaetales bacterium]
MSVIGFFLPPGKNGFGYSSTAETVTSGLDLTGKTYLITGCNSGLGLESARVLSLRGAKILGTARTAEKAFGALAPLGNGHKGFACELADPLSIRQCVTAVMREEGRLDGILANAGIMALPSLEKAYGYELQFFTNHVGHFILITGLLEKLVGNGRVVVVSSSAHTMAPAGGIDFENLSGDRGYRPWTAYGQSKMANILFASELARRFKGSSRVAVSLHPGVIQTNLGRHMPAVARFAFGMVGPIFQKSIPEGAATQCYALVHPEAGALSGQYLADVNVATPRKEAADKALALKLWEVTENIVGKIRG